MEVISYNQSVLPDEIAELIIFEHADILTLIMLSKTCKKYRSEYIVRFYPFDTVAIMHDIDGESSIVVPYLCSKILHNPYVLNWDNGFGEGSYTYPKVTHRLTARIISELLAQMKPGDDIQGMGFEI
jgi:hypothetical protein